MKLPFDTAFILYPYYNNTSKNINVSILIDGLVVVIENQEEFQKMKPQLMLTNRNCQKKIRVQVKLTDGVKNKFKLGQMKVGMRQKNQN